MIDTSKKHYHALWISDLHLGTRAVQAQHLLEFLKCHGSDTLYFLIKKAKQAAEIRSVACRVIRFSGKIIR